MTTELQAAAAKIKENEHNRMTDEELEETAYNIIDRIEDFRSI